MLGLGYRWAYRLSSHSPLRREVSGPMDAAITSTAQLTSDGQSFPFESESGTIVCSRNEQRDQ